MYTKQVYYITKKGDKAPKQYGEPYQVAALEQVGKNSLGAILQMPGSARNASQKMYQDEYYYLIFGETAKEGIIADLLKISYYYDCFRKTEIKNRGYDEKAVLPVLENGKTFQLAAIGFLCKIYNKVFTYDTVKKVLGNTDELKKILQRTDDMTQIITNSIQNEKEIFFSIFSEIGEEVLGYCFSNGLDIAEEEQRTLAPSNHLKSDNSYYKDVIKRLWRIYNKSKNLYNAIEMICKPENI